MKHLFFLLFLLISSFALKGQTCKHDSIFTYKFSDILPERIADINLEEEEPYSIDIIEDGKKIITYRHHHKMSLQETCKFYYNNHGLLTKEVVSSWIKGTDEIEVDSTIYTYEDTHLLEKKEFRSSSIFSQVITTYVNKNDTIMESKNYGGFLSLMSKRYYPKNDSVYMEVICNINPKGYTLQKYDAHGEIFEIYSCTNNNECKLHQKRIVTYDKCGRILEKRLQYVTSNRLFNYDILKYN